MFSLPHILWLGALALLIAGLAYLTQKVKISFQTITYILCAFMALCQLEIIIEYMVPVSPDTVLPFRQLEGEMAGMVLDPTAIPFHLCGLQTFLVTYTAFSKNERVVHALRVFMLPSMLLGALCACLVPTEGTGFTIRAIEYFLYHGALILYAIIMLLRGVTKMTWRDYGRNFLILLGIAFFGMWINSFLAAYNTNFLYLVRPPMEGLPLLNLDHGWSTYILTYLGLVGVIFATAQLPLVLYYNKKRKEAMDL